MKHILLPQASIDAMQAPMNPDEIAYVSRYQKGRMMKLVLGVVLLIAIFGYMLYGMFVTADIEKSGEVLFFLAIFVCMFGFMIHALKQTMVRSQSEQQTPMKRVYTTTLERKQEDDDDNEYELFFQGFRDDVEIRSREAYAALIEGKMYQVHMSEQTGTLLSIVDATTDDILYRAW